mgnify:CR=1 FL=1
MEWFSYAVAVILLVSSIISPIITTIISNCHQTKLKKIRMDEASTRKALAEFIECAQDYLLNPHYIEQSVKYYSSMDKLFIYFTGIDINTFIPFDNVSKNTDNYKMAIFELTKIVQFLSKQIKKE